VDAFNPPTGWYDTDVLGIDLGITMVMTENHRPAWLEHLHEEQRSARCDDEGWISSGMSQCGGC
jgi:hypothetical protein